MDYQLKKEGKFQYIEEGNGPVLLLLHGLFGALSNWHSVLDHFSHRYRVVIPLMPLYTMNVLKTNIGGLSDFIHEFVKFKGYEKVTLVGNSLGGHVGLVYALEHLNRVHSVVLTGSSGLYEEAMGGTYPKRGNYEFIKEKTEYTFYDPKTATKELVDEVYEIVNSRVKALKILHLAKSAIRHNMSKEVKNITVPACLIWGNDDKITPPEVAHEFKALMPDAELHFIEKCGHAPMMEVPDKFNELMDSFLSRVYSQTQVA